MSKQIGFKPQARIILQLGDQLIRNESIALLELIKNSYDACARKVTVELKNLEDQKLGEIRIQDDGFGMDYDTIRDIWLHPGTAFKRKQIDDDTFTSPCGRSPLGEKGIGRFGAHKLGQEIELISKTEKAKEVYLKIKWRDFDNDKLLEDIPVKLIERPAEVFKKGEHGTIIIIRELRSQWTRGSVRELYRAVNSLNSPFKALNSFRVQFKIDKQEWLSGLLKFDQVKDSSLYTAEVVIEGNEIKSFEYEFTPWPSMKGLKSRIHSEQNIAMVKKVFDEKVKKKVLKDIDISYHKIGKIKLKILIFDLDHEIMSMGVEDKKGLKDYLKLNGGVRVYRDGVRVYDYGEPGNDWLNLDQDRVNFPTARISNNIVIGSVQLERLKSKDLVEKTNREGFIQNEAFWEFYGAVKFTLGRIITQRNIDKDSLRNYFGKGNKIPVSDNLQLLKDKVESNIPDTKIRKEIVAIISEIQADYKTISEVYIRSASAGLSLSIVIHEIEKIIQELLWVVEETSSKESNFDRIKSLTWHLGKLVDGYSGLIRRRSRRETDLKQVIINGLGNVEFRLRAHQIEIIGEYDKKKKFESRVRCSDSLIIGVIVNIIDNSIWWLNYGKVKTKKIFIDISNEMPGYLAIIIADNGPGFTIPTEDVIKPFISNKDGGIGIGLHIANEIMNSHDGELLFPASGQFTIPKDFKSGAIIALAFKLSKN
ncbi:MAG: ATP-binding protein [Cyclobacteriaceae bacterium]|nr:ATP-binding protein [Cyclobacteriaceae bacterium]